MRLLLRGLLAMMVALALCALGMPALAQPAPFASGWLAQCTAIGAGTCTEQTAAGYARQPMTYALLKGGLLVRAQPFAYSPAVQGTIAGRALYDAPSGGNLLFVSPLPSGGYTIPSVSGDRQDVGTGEAITLTGAGSTADPTGFSGSFRAASAIGTNANGTVYAGVALSVLRGELFPLPDEDPSYVQVTPATGFSVQMGNTTSTVDVLGSATLGTGTILLPVSPLDGAFVRIECAPTVTTLTVTPGSGSTITGTAPSSCGPNASHTLHYHNGTWSVLF